MKCQKCQALIVPESKYCVSCGEFIDYTRVKVSDLILGSFLFTFGLTFFVFFGVKEWGLSFAISLIIMIIWCAGTIVYEKGQQKIKDENQEKRLHFFAKHQIPGSCKQFSYFGGYPNLSGSQSLYLWVEKGCLNILPIKVSATKHQIPTNDIISFSTKGDLKQETERKTIINANIDGENKFILFEKADVYNYLLENIPEKEISFVIGK